LHTQARAYGWLRRARERAVAHAGTNVRMQVPRSRVFVRLLLGVMLFWCCSLAARAEVLVGDVLRACDAALAQNDESLDAAMCDWYLRPCGICGEPGANAWCLPATLTKEELVHQMLGWLRAAPRTAAAKPLVEKILREHFPCAAQDYPAG